MLLYTENAKGSTKKLLKLINEFSKVAGYKINIQLSKKEENHPIYNNIVEINLTKVRYLTLKTITLMKESKKIQVSRKIACVHGLEELILLKCP